MRWMESSGISSLRVDRSTAELLRQFAGLPEPEAGISFVEQAEALRGDPRLESYFTDGSGKHYKAFVQDPQDQGVPAAMTHLLARLWQDELLSPASTLILKNIMLRCETGANRIPAGLPAGTSVAHKTGTIAGTVNDVGVITLPGDRGHLVVSVLIKNALGSREDHERTIADIVRLAFDAYVGDREE